MLRSRLRRPSPALIVASLALVAALGGVAVAGPIDNAGRVHFCYDQTTVDTQDGNVVVLVNDADDCPADFPQRLVINQTGPKGAPGRQGPKGPAGPIGAPGVKPMDAVLGEKVQQKLEKLDEKADKRDAKLEALKRKLRDAERERGQIKGDALAKRQRELADHLQAFIASLRALQDAQANMARQISAP